MFVTWRTSGSAPSAIVEAKRLGIPVRSDDQTTIDPSGAQKGALSTARSRVTSATRSPASLSTTMSISAGASQRTTAIRVPSGDQRG